MVSDKTNFKKIAIPTTQGLQFIKIEDVKRSDTNWKSHQGVVASYSLIGFVKI